MSNLKHRLGQDNFKKKEYIRKAKDRNFYGFTHDDRGQHSISLAIDFFQKDGNRFGIYYLEIASPVRFNLGGGTANASISFTTPSVDITIEGRNLNVIYEYLLEQRLVWLKEKDTSVADVPEGEPIIESIRIEER